MESGLKAKIIAALKEACLPDKEPDVRLDSTSGGHVGGVVLSKAFEGLDPSARQDLIWAKLDSALSPYEKTLISFLLTETPDEYEVVRQYPTLDKVEPEAFARAVKYRAGALAKREDAEDLADKARKLAVYATKGDELSPEAAKARWMGPRPGQTPRQQGWRQRSPRARSWRARDLFAASREPSSIALPNCRTRRPVACSRLLRRRPSLSARPRPAPP